MTLRVVEDACIGCGGCEYACPTGSLHKTDSFLGLFAIDPYTCNDCGECVPKCPVDAIVTMDDWPVCQGHGCPLSSQRLHEVVCAYWLQRCSSCGGTLWQRPGGAWECPRCGLGMKVTCPKVHHLSEVPPAEPAHP